MPSPGSWTRGPRRSSPTRLQETVTGLQEMVGGTPSRLSDQALEANHVIQQIRNSVSSLAGTEQTQGRQFGALQATVDTTSGNLLATRQLLEGVLVSGGVRWQAPPEEAGALGALGVPGMAGPAGVTAAHVAAAPSAPTPLFGQFVDAELHSRALGVLGFGVGRADMQQLAAAISTAGLAQITFPEWWVSVQTTKTMIQWKAKATAYGCPEGAVNELTSFRLVGQALFSNVVSDGTWHSSSMQHVILQ
ncbi:unnamed protein product [Prorocentrum cordatum]|uniref:Uncharacterized protein n=1 Tax=Prorocentrum cordatum TaxID=2364126 RepID=A0ABN9XB00_9DINO|nr:unnamed protein product [Polarella glacialis]